MIVDQCVILLGGLGTRLGNLTRDTPKPLLPTEAGPFVDILVKEALRRGFRKFLFLAGHRSEVVDEYATQLRATLPPSVEISVSTEPEPLGTGGALTHATEKLDPRFLLLNGDTWFDFNWLDICDKELAETGVLAARRIPFADRYESLRLSANGQVEAFIPRGIGDKTDFLINGGVYCLNRKDFAGFPNRFSLEQDWLPHMVATGKLMARAYDGYFVDIGLPETYETARIEAPQNQRRKAIFFDRDGVLNLDHGHVGSRDRFEWVEGARDAVRLANDLGYYTFVVTNQAGVGKGYYTEADVQALHQWMGTEMRDIGAWIDDWRYCPFHPEAVLPQYRKHHDWRKPGAGMLLDLMQAWPIEQQGSLLIGDKASDMEAAKAAGVKGTLFSGGNLCAFLREQVGQTR